jgi:NADH:ubiquinone oxidoreductase subunit 2 (subunit N)
VFYYMRVASIVFSGEAPADVTVRRSAMAGAALTAAVSGVLIYGIVPARLTAAVQQAAALLK